MRSLLATTMILFPALGLLTGCGREPGVESSQVQRDLQEFQRKEAERERLQERWRESERRDKELHQLKQAAKSLSPEGRADFELKLIELERAQLKGKWVAIAHTFDGTAASAAELQDNPRRWIVGDSQIDSQWLIAGETIDERLRFSAYPLTRPKTITLLGDIFDDPRAFRGIYELDGDSLTICLTNLQVLANVQAEESRDFSAPKGSKRILMVWKRVKE